MNRKIFLDGHLGKEITPVLDFCGDSVAEAFRCIQANYPDFRKYLIEAHEQDIGFSVEIQGRMVEDPRECLLPFREGDIIITPVIGGSKSGGGKILAAAAIAALLFIPGGANLLLPYGAKVAPTSLASGLSAAGGAYATAGLVASSLAINLALTGIQQLMAPDPSVDSDPEESYLFNGGQRNVSEGDPVPVLYGELRVPGMPVSLNIDQDDYKSGSDTVSVNTLTDPNGNVFNTANSGSFDSEENPATPLSTDGTLGQSNVKGGGGPNDNGDGSSAEFNDIKSNAQYITAVDIISEGPIYGLVNGTASVYFDDKPLADSSDSGVYAAATSADFTFNGTTTVTTANVPSNLDFGDFTEKRYLTGIGGETGTTSSVTPVVYPNNTRINVTTTFSIFNSIYKIGSGDSVTGKAESYTFVNLIDSEGQVVASGPIETYITGNQVIIATEGFINRITDYTATYSVRVDVAHEISSYSSGTFTLASASTLNGTFKGNISGNSLDSDTIATSKYRTVTSQFRTGALGQAPIISKNSSLSSAAAVTTSVSNAIVGPGDTGTQVYEYAGSDFYSGGTVDKYTQTDLVKILFNYPALYNRKDTGEIGPGKAYYKIEIAFASDSAGSSFGAYQTVVSELKHGGQHTSPISFLETIDLNKFRTSFTNFKIKVTRLSNVDMAQNFYDAFDPSASNVPGYEGTSAATITQLTAVISEPLTWPYTAYAHTRFSTRDFPNNPKRTYLCRGMKVLVPDTYTTREKSSTGVASYSGTWSGAFKSEKEYTNNPAWVFYDMVVNNRYGLGNWIQETDIDKFALYRIAKYCDELVPDGNGGQEPRFTSNVYLTKATDAYKVLKDLATIFRGMLYWLDGQIYAVSDRAGDPIYNFSKGNVIDGTFAYEGTGNRTRSNQVIVTWNNPSSDYRQEALIVEDRENIIKTSKIISENAVAFGATSEGQALRYGRWKLWTAINQTEIVSFKTAINAAFLMPGDIIQVQDADRHPGDVRYSGRISSTGTLSTTQVPLDSFVELNVGSTYELSVLITSPGAFLNQDTATISSAVYNRGDLIPGITTESAASNLTDDSSDDVQVTWSEYTRVESQPVSTGAGTVNALTVSSPFTAAPQAQNVWALRETNSDGLPVLGSAKSYKILSITEDSKNEYSITAVEHYNEKFDSIDDDFVLSVTDPVNPPLEIDDSIPPPKNLKMILENLDNGTVANDGTLSWDAPDYGFIGGYRITHTFGPKFQPSYLVSRDTTTVTGFNLPLGTYTVFVQTVATNGNRSRAASVTFGVGVEKEVVASRIFSVPIGATSTQDIDIQGTNLQFEANTYEFTTKGNPTRQYEFTSGASDTYIQDVSGVPSQDFSAMGSDVERRNNSHFIYFDASNTSDPLRLVKYYNDITNNIWYLYDTGSGGGAPSTYWSAGSGTISVPAGSSTITGSGTSFLTDFAVGGYIKAGSTVATVTQVNSDTELLVNLINSDTAISGAAYEKPQFNVDINNDCIFGYVRNDSSISPSLRFYPMELTIKRAQAESKIVRLESDDYSVVYDTSTSPDTVYISNGTSPPTITITATQSGFSNPVYRFKVNGAEFPAGSPEWVTDNFISGQVPATLADWNTGFFGSNPVTVSVEVSEDTPVKEVQATDSVSIFAVADGVDGNDGIDGYTVINTRAAVVLPSLSDGTVTSYSGSGTTFEVFKGAVELEGITTGTPTAGEYKITAVGTNITASSTNGAAVSPGGAITFSDHSGMTADTAEITYTFDLEGTSSGTQKQSFTVGKQGIDGTQGDDGLRTIQGYLYYESTGAPLDTVGGREKAASDGTEVYFLSGLSASSTATKDHVEINSSAGTFTPLTDAPDEYFEGHEYNASTGLYYGYTGASTGIPFASYSTTASPSWTTLSDPNIAGAVGFHPDPAMGTYGNDLLIFGGVSAGNYYYKYSISGDSWTTPTPSGGPAKYPKQAGYAAPQSGTGTGKMYVSCGLTQGPLTDIDQLLEIDLSTDTITSLTSLGYAKQDNGLVAPGNGKLYDFGGKPRVGTTNYDQKFREYDIATDTWTELRDGTETENVDRPAQRTKPVMWYTTGKVYIYGGYSVNRPDGGGAGYLHDLWEYDIATDTFTNILPWDGVGISNPAGAAPSAPSGNTYTFSTGVVSGTGIDDAGTTNVWKNSPNTQDPTSPNTHYTIRYYGTEAAAASSTISVTYSPVVQYTNFTGVVTFSGGTFQEGGTNITTIDGGNITTGSITTDKLQSGLGTIDADHVFGIAAEGLKVNSTPFDSTAIFKTTHNTACTALFAESTGGNNSNIALAGATTTGSAAAFANGNDAGGAGSYGANSSMFVSFCTNDTTPSPDTNWLIYASSDSISAGTRMFSVDKNGDTYIKGDLDVVGDVTAFFSSDQRLKDNIVKISNSLEKVSQLGGYEFDWNHVSPYEGMHDIGVIAQEVLKVAPEAVTRRDNDMLAVRYEKLVPLLIEAINELKKEVEELKRGSSND